ncbi:hypothetical protein LINPERHAP2_LOCUS9755 [Linum perenne]
MSSFTGVEVVLLTLLDFFEILIGLCQLSIQSQRVIGMRFTGLNPYDHKFVSKKRSIGNRRHGLIGWP